jgi:hypothetical protein
MRGTGSGLQALSVIFVPEENGFLPVFLVGALRVLEIRCRQAGSFAVTNVKLNGTPRPAWASAQITAPFAERLETLGRCRCQLFSRGASCHDSPGNPWSDLMQGMSVMLRNFQRHRDHYSCRRLVRWGCWLPPGVLC